MFLDFNLIRKKVPDVVIIFFLIDFVLILAYIMNYLAGQPYGMPTRLLDLNGESSFAAWYSSVQLFCVFVLSAVFSYPKIRQNGKSFPLIMLPAVFLLMSIDESVQIHEWLGVQSDILFPEGVRAGTAYYKTGIWMIIIGIPFLALFLWLSYSLKYHFSNKPSSLKKLVLGMIVMLSGALGFEFLSNFVEEDLWIIEVAFEEGLEMAGVTIMLWAMYEMATDYLPDLNQDNIPERA